jgi:NAD(P)-dependent dehydrogenase (short-subunit alcohol dehydrogenase family)
VSASSELPLGTRRVLVVGGGSGIGKAIATALIARGGRVAVCGRRAARLDEVVRASGGSAIALPCDVADPTARSGLLARARDLLGGLDGFVCAAGVAAHTPIGSIAEDALRAQLEVNLVAPMRLGEEGLQVIAPGGAMLFVTSTLALRPLPETMVYSASKAGLAAVVQALAAAGAARGIRASSVCPAAIDTEMIRAPRTKTELDALAARHPLGGRLGTPEDVADAALHLLAAPWTTGAMLVVDGGAMTSA